MTKKDYELIAGVVKAIGQREIEARTLAFIANQFSRELSLENFRFDTEKFKKACGLAGY
jgi:hypothetical protein